MELDYQLMFDASTTLPLAGVSLPVTAGSTQASTNVIDFSQNRDMGTGDGQGETPKIMVLVTTTFTSTGAGTLQIGVQTSTDGTTYNTVVSSPAFTSGALTAGRRIFEVFLPSLAIDPPTAGTSSSNYGLPRYMRLLYTAAVSSFSAGAIIAGIVLGDDRQRTYPPGVAVTN